MLKRFNLPGSEPNLEARSLRVNGTKDPLVHQVRDWFSGAAAYFGWMREAKRENTRCGLRPMSDKAANQKTRSPKGCDENGPAATLLLGHVSIQICSFVAPCRRPIFIATPLNQSRTWCTRPRRTGAFVPFTIIPGSYKVADREMSFQSLITKWQTLNSSVEALAALGAELRLRTEQLNGDSRVRSLLLDVMRRIDPELLDGIDANEERAALALIQTSFRQAIDLIENPARAPGWHYEDPVILESQGQVSRLIVRSIDTLAAQRPDLGDALHRPGAFLDVGTGVGWLAIEAARAWPAVRVVGIDSWEPALVLARKNLSRSGVAERVEFRSQRVEDLDDQAIFTLAWLPGPFIAAEIITVALERIDRALTPGGWLIFGLLARPEDPLGEALSNLRIVRSGGHPWTIREVEERLGAQGFERIEAFSPAPSIMLVLSQRTDAKRSDD